MVWQLGCRELTSAEGESRRERHSDEGKELKFVRAEGNGESCHPLKRE